MPQDLLHVAKTALIIIKEKEFDLLPVALFHKFKNRPFRLSKDAEKLIEMKKESELINGKDVDEAKLRDLRLCYLRHPRKLRGKIYRLSQMEAKARRL